MTAISLKLPDELARKSTQAAEKMGISRTELIRVALEHELADISRRLERADMAKAFEAMRQDPDYERESATLDPGLMEDLPNEPENWWQG
jgi:predicted transcriptional regulator